MSIQLEGMVGPIRFCLQETRSRALDDLNLQPHPLDAEVVLGEAGHLQSAIGRQRDILGGLRQRHDRPLVLNHLNAVRLAVGIFLALGRFEQHAEAALAVEHRAETAGPAGSPATGSPGSNDRLNLLLHVEVAFVPGPIGPRRQGDLGAPIMFQMRRAGHIEGFRFQAEIGGVSW